MGAKIIYERFLWLHGRVKARKYPNARNLCEHFGITHKTAQRDIEFIRDRMGAPLVYVHERRGYTYDDDSYELPGLWLNEEELISLLVSYRVASLIPDHALKGSMKTFLNHVLSLRGTTGKVSMDDLNEKVSVKNIEYSSTSGKTFHLVLDHLLRNKPMQIEYYSPHNDENTTRDILPLHLLHLSRRGVD
jgi:predicted DNA-binding transcriptional regulator YafY